MGFMTNLKNILTEVVNEVNLMKLVYLLYINYFVIFNHPVHYCCISSTQRNDRMEKTWYKLLNLTSPYGHYLTFV